MQDVAISVEDFRQRARTWLAANLDKRPPGEAPSPRGRPQRTPEAMAVGAGASSESCTKVALPASPGPGSTAARA